MKNISLEIKTLCCFIMLLAISEICVAQSTIYKVTAYGANPNDKLDDTESIQKCINDALQSNENITIQFPKSKSSTYGYRINKSIQVDIVKNHAITISGDMNGYTNLFMRGEATRFPIYCGLYIRSKPEYSGTVTVTGFNIEGKFSKSLQSYIDQATGAKGIFLVNIRKAVIAQNRFKNIYGDGIWCNGSNTVDATDKITIENNRFINVFGLNLTADKYSGGENYDNYGDGISITNLQNVLIQNNVITNNLLESNSYGRAGIVLERNSANCTLINNVINGYDRGIHIEGDKGGHMISNNKISGTNMAIFVYSVKRTGKNPIQIQNNLFSYNNESTKYKLTHLHAAYPVFILIDGNQSEHLVGTVIRNNTFTYEQPIAPKKIVNDFLYIPLQGGVSWCGNTYYSGKTKLSIDKDCK